MSEPVRLVLATHNAHKVQELRRILGPALDGLELVAYDGPEPIEDGDTVEEHVQGMGTLNNPVSPKGTR